MMGNRIKLTYFKRTGKFYTQAEYTTRHAEMWDVCRELQELNPKPGLSTDGNEFFILAEAHDWGYPFLIVPKGASISEIVSRTSTPKGQLVWD